MKKLKLLSIILAFAMLLGSMSAFAAVEYYGDTAITPNGDGITASQEGGLKGKVSGDMVYRISGGSASSTKYIAVTGNLGLNPVVFETTFMLPSDTDYITTWVNYYKDNSTVSDSRKTYNFLNIKTEGFSTRTSSGTNLWNLTDEADYTIESGKWYTLVIEFPANGDTIGNIYLNGTKVHTFTRNSSNDNTIYGVRNLNIASTASTSIYLDNIHGYKNVTDYTFNIADSTPSYVTGGEGVSVENNVVTVPFGTTAEQLKNIVTTTDGAEDIKRVYTTADMTTEAQVSDLADGKTLVIAAKNGKGREMAYSYYTVVQSAPVDPDADVLKGASADDIKFSDDASAENVVLETGVYGKKADDAAYKVVGSSSVNTIISLPRTLNGGSNTFSTGKAGVIEFSFCLPEGCDGIDTSNSTGRTASQYDGNNYKSIPTISIKKDGIYTSDYKFYHQEIKANTWYNIAVEMATDGTSTYKIYVNGNEEFTSTSEMDWKGFRTFNIKPIKKGQTFYIDNISSSQTYNNALNVPVTPNAQNITFADGKLTALKGANVSDITLGENEAVRLYKADWTVAANLDEAAYAVFATTNGRSIERVYTYYNVDLKNCLVNYNVSENALNANLESVTQSTLIIAWYTSDKTLVNLTAVPAELTNGVYVSDVENLNINSNYDYRIFVWDSVDGLNPLIKATDVK